MATKRLASVQIGHDRGTGKRHVSIPLSPTGLGGVAFGIVAGGALAGPVGALVGAALGGFAGEALEAAIPSKANNAAQNDVRPSA